MILFIIVYFTLTINCLSQNYNPLITYNEDCRLGIINKLDSDTLAPFVYESICKVIDNTPIFHASYKGKNDYFFIDNNQSMKLPYEKMSSVNDKLILVETKGLKGIISSDGEGILVQKFEKIDLYNNYLIAKYQNQFGLYDLTGNLIKKHQYKNYSFWGENGIWLEEEEGKHIFFNTIESITHKFKYQLEKSNNNYYQSIIIDSIQAIINLKFDTVVLCKSKDIVLCEDKLFYKETKWAKFNSNAVINKKVKKVISWQNGEYYSIHKDDSIFIFNSKNELILHQFSKQYKINNLFNDILILAVEDKYMICNINNPNKYIEADNFIFNQNYNGLFIQKNNDWLWYNYELDLNSRGYDNLSALKNKHYFHVFVNDKIGLFNAESGNEIIPPEYNRIIPDIKFIKVKKESSDWVRFDKNGTLINCK